MHILRTSFATATPVRRGRRELLRGGVVEIRKIADELEELGARGDGALEGFARAELLH